MTIWARKLVFGRSIATPDPEAILDINFAKQTYWWNGAFRTTANFTTYNLNGSTFGAQGLTPSATIDITLNISAFWTAPGAMVLRFYQSAIPGTVRGIYQIDDGTDNLYNSFEQNANANHAFRAFSSANGGMQAQITRASTANAIGGYAASFDLNNYRFYLDGIAGTPSVSGVLPAPVSILRIGKKVAASSNCLGAIGRIILYDSVQNDAWLQEHSNRVKA